MEAPSPPFTWTAGWTPRGRGAAPVGHRHQPGGFALDSKGAAGLYQASLSNPFTDISAGPPHKRKFTAAVYLDEIAGAGRSAHRHLAPQAAAQAALNIHKREAARKLTRRSLRFRLSQRTDIRFDEGITGIVGPNGSGKSNIADAVRWVLGEQSAKALRGAKMEDVIFAGTQKRRLMPYCEVSLVFDNADGQLKNPQSEVMVTRRAYRTGEGEYSLNRKSCRLKDIVELFHDTGIGREGYSIIGQGIDVILSGSSVGPPLRRPPASWATARAGRPSASSRTQDNLRVGDLLRN